MAEHEDDHVVRFSARLEGRPATIILLHGLGDTPKSLQLLVNEFHRRDAMAHLSIVLPKAPVGSVAARPGPPITRWFDVNAIGPETLDEFTQDTEGMTESVRFVERVVADEIERGVPPDRIILGGFSSGAALTIAFAVTSKQKVAGFIAMSGFMPFPTKLKQQASKVNQSVPFLMTHGTSDDQVLYETSRESVRLLRHEFGFKDVKYERFTGMLHNIDPDCLVRISTWIERLMGFDTAG